MTDEQLREAVARAIEAADLARPHDPYNHLALADAAIALMRPVIRAENERLRAALRDIIADSFSIYAIAVARAALEGKQ